MKIVMFTAVKNRYMLHRRVFVMNFKKLNVEKVYKNASHGMRTLANITGSMTEVLHVSTALFFRIIKHVKNKQLKLVPDFTCNNIFTQQFGTITAITLNIFKRLFMIFYTALWLKWNQKWSILLNVLSESFNTHKWNKLL